MKKTILFSVLSTAFLWGFNVKSFYMKDSLNKISFYIKGDLQNTDIKIYIDSDRNRKTGYNDSTVKGADYLIQKGTLYKYTNKWEAVTNRVEETEIKNGKKIEIYKEDIILMPYIHAFAKITDNNTETIKTTTKNILNHKKDTYVKEFYNYWKDTYLVAQNDGTLRVAFDKNDKSKTVSEGQGYGMIITALMDGYDKNAQKNFDKLFKFVKKHPSKLTPNLMAWIYPESENGEDSAFDGDTDIAYALILADTIWGSEGDINYREEAAKILKSIWEKTIGPDSKLPMLGDWVDPNGKKYNQYTVRLSDCMPEHFKVFAKFTNDDKWLQVINACEEVINDVADSTTGLIPDFAVKDKDLNKFIPAYPNFLESKHDGDYHYNACRVPLRIGSDALINDRDFSNKTINKISNWLKSTISSVTDIKSGYKLNGSAYNNYFSTAFASPFAVGMLKTDKKVSDDIFEYIKQEKQNYYEDSLNLLSMCVLSGRYKYILNKIKPYEDTKPPYEIEKFQKILDHSGLQYPQSNYVRQPGEFEGFKTDYFYARENNLIFDLKQNKDYYVKRIELREKYPDKENYGEWKTSTKKQKKLYAKVKFSTPEYLKEFTFLQIHDDGNKEISVNKPLLRIVWLKSKSQNGKTYENYIWAALKTDASGENTEFIPLVQHTDSKYLKITIKVKKNKLYIKANKKKITKDVSFWKDYYNYFKAGIYISGSVNNTVEESKREAKIEFKELSF